MGMAASQARFLSLTARKSNVEYEGQQINQERTALANESSNLYSQLSKMDVPTPPATSDFYKPVYTFVATELSGEKTTYTLEEIVSTPDGDKAVVTYKEPYYAVSMENLGSTGATISKGKTYDDLSESEKLDYNNVLSGKQITKADGSTYQIYEANSTEYESTLKTLATENGGNAAFMEYLDANGDVKPGKNVYWYEAGNQKYFLNPTDVEKGKSTTASLYIMQEYKNKKDELEITNYTTNDIGRTTSVTIMTDEDENGNPIEYTYELSCTSVEDEVAYAQAMLDYEYHQALYEKAVSDINAKTEAIQQEDKSLELELKQLDTEQNAISTEMDAVTKVVEDNVEATFKTFA